jgi:nitrous oxidase accessory protein NosD
VKATVAAFNNTVSGTLILLSVWAVSTAFDAWDVDVISVCRAGCDYTSIQEAVDAAPTGATIEIHPGFYQESIVMRHKRLMLKGAGQNQVTIRSVPPPPYPFPTGATVLIGRNADVTIDGIRIEGTYDGVYVAEHGSHAIIRNSTIAAQRIGVEVLSSAELYNNFFLEHWYCALNGKFNAEPLVGANNRFINSPLCGNVDPGLRIPLVEQTDRTELRVPQDYPSVQAAIDALHPDGTILIDPFYYGYENVTITKSLTLKGLTDGAFRPTLDGDGRLALSTLVAAEEIIVEGLVVRNGSQGIVISSPSTTIRDNRFTENIVDAIASGHPHTSLPKTVIIENNIIEGTQKRYGIILSTEEARISNNLSTRNGGSGVYLLYPTEWVEISDNTITNNGTHNPSRQRNAGWGISAAVPGCDETWMDTVPFTGKVVGNGNVIQGNFSGEVCPESLRFLMEAP